MSREDPTTQEDQGVPLGKRTRKEWRFAVRLARYEALRPNWLIPSLFWRLRHWHLRRWVNWRLQGLGERELTQTQEDE